MIQSGQQCAPRSQASPIFGSADKKQVEIQFLEIPAGIYKSSTF
jgi:hypothetical protein